MLAHWCTCVMHSKVQPMKEVAAMIRKHLDGIIAWPQTRQTNGFLEALNGLFQSAKRRARGFARFSTIRTVIFLIAEKLPHVQPSCHLTHSDFNRASIGGSPAFNTGWIQCSASFTQSPGRCTTAFEK
jgi:hypothetical protein